LQEGGPAALRWWCPALGVAARSRGTRRVGAPSGPARHWSIRGEPDGQPNGRRREKGTWMVFLECGAFPPLLFFFPLPKRRKSAALQKSGVTPPHSKELQVRHLEQLPLLWPFDLTAADALDADTLALDGAVDLDLNALEVRLEDPAADARHLAADA